MTGPEHYREAEALLTLAKEARNAEGPWQGVTAAAQAHATLALAAATDLALDDLEAAAEATA